MNAIPLVGDWIAGQAVLVRKMLRSKGQRYRYLLNEVFERESLVKDATDEELRKQGKSLRYRFREAKPHEIEILPDAFALVREATVRSLGVRVDEKELLAGIAMAMGDVASVIPGERNLLAMGMAAYFHSLGGKGVHMLATSDTEARRDYEQLRPLLQFCGTTSALIDNAQNKRTRTIAYECEITFVSYLELGMDFLRDRLLIRRVQEFGEQIDDAGEISNEDRPTVRGLNIALLNDIDSILLDQGITPFIIGAVAEADDQYVAWKRWAAASASQFTENRDYELSGDPVTVDLLRQGRERVRRLGKGEGLGAYNLVSLYECIEQAINARLKFQRDRDYVLIDGKVVLVDTTTGRLAMGRRWRDGTHQAIEAKEGLEITFESGQAARVTVLELFLQYAMVTGCSPTAREAATELKRLYGLRVVDIPPSRPPQRIRLQPKVFATRKEKIAAIVDEVIKVHAAKRPILIGTFSLSLTSILSQQLDAAGLRSTIIDGRDPGRDAESLSRAGAPESISILVGEAGRGIPIRVQSADHRGLHLIIAEPHPSTRVDSRLVAACGIGHPGEFREYSSLDDYVVVLAKGRKRASQYQKKATQSPATADGLHRLVARCRDQLDQRSAAARLKRLRYYRQWADANMSTGRDLFVDG